MLHLCLFTRDAALSSLCPILIAQYDHPAFFQNSAYITIFKRYQQKIWLHPIFTRPFTEEKTTYL